MADRQLDVLFVNPNSSKKVYQDLSKDFSAIEVPVWSLLLAESCRRAGFWVHILDCDAQRLDLGAAHIVNDINPRLVCFVVYGQNPNSGTTNMTGALALAKVIREWYPFLPICFVGSHTQALPLDVLSNDCVDFVLLNEGVYALQNLLMGDLTDEEHLSKVRGIGWKSEDCYPCDGGSVGGLVPHLNEPEKVVGELALPSDLPGYAWDLLPKKEKPLDLYRSHFWHADFQYEYRTPAAAIYTSLGCPYKCNFCMINNLNRHTNDSNWSAADSAKIRYFPTGMVLRELDKLVHMGVRTIRISDEMFFLNKNHYVPLLEGIRERYRDSLRLWAYARVDTVKSQYLKLFREAGVRWLALGIETASQTIRREVSKGSYQEVDVRRVVKEIQDAGINVIANYVFGLPDDDMKSMQETLDLSIELNAEMWNAYPIMALPGSPLHRIAKEKGWPLPDSFEGYSFHSYECLPLQTKYLSSAEVLKFRDEAFHKYFERPEYLSMIEGTFGGVARKNIEELTKVKLKRKLLGD